MACAGAASAAQSVWRVLVVDPLRTLYFYGPNVHGYGFWGGVEAADACAQLTGVSALVWDVQTVACHDLLERNFFSFSVVVMAAVYLWLIYKVLQHLAFRYLYVRPLFAELRAALRELPQRELSLRDLPLRESLRETPAFLDSGVSHRPQIRAAESDGKPQQSQQSQLPQDEQRSGTAAGGSAGSSAGVSVPGRHAVVCAPRICRCASPELGCSAFPSQRTRSNSSSSLYRRRRAAAAAAASSTYCAAAVPGRASACACTCNRDSACTCCRSVASAAAAVQAAAAEITHAARQEGGGHQA